jgi:hypothetical protein
VTNHTTHNLALQAIGANLDDQALWQAVWDARDDAGLAWRSDRQARAYPPAGRRRRADTRHGRRTGTVARCHRDQAVAGLRPLCRLGNRRWRRGRARWP